MARVAGRAIKVIIGIVLFIVGFGLCTMAQESGRIVHTPQRKSCRIARNGDAVDFVVDGRMPAQTRVSATPLERDDVDGTPMLAAYDITLTDDNGNEWQPVCGQPAQVTITDPSFGNGRTLDIYHESDEGREYVATVMSVNNTVTFAAKHFSVFLVGVAGGQNRLVVSFIRAKHNDLADPDTLHPDWIVDDTLSILLKRHDTIDNGNMLKKLLYPPGPGYLSPGVKFFGWAGERDYPVNPNGYMTIQDVRDSVFRRLSDTANKFGDHTDTLKFYSVRLKSHNVYYRSQLNNNVVVGVDNVLYHRDDSDEQGYIVNEAYVPQDLSTNFLGWMLAKGGENVNYGKAESNLYQNGDSISITGDITFVEDLAYGNWLIFNEVMPGATYVAPKFLKSNDYAGIAGDRLEDNEPNPNDLKCYGYQFAGWYTDISYEEEFLFEGYLEHQTTVYAKWIPNETANYTILFWQQNTNLDGYDFVESYSAIGTVGSTINSQAIETGESGDLTYVVVDGIQRGGIPYVLHNQETDPYAGFTLVTPVEEVVITPDGRATLNLYFNRVQYTLKLYVARTEIGSPGIIGTQRGNSTRPDLFLGWWPEISGNNTSYYLSLSYLTKLFGKAPTKCDTSGSYLYWYFPIVGHYGKNITGEWPAYDSITSSAKFISWILMSTAKAFDGEGSDGGTGNSNGGNTIKGYVSILDEQVLGKLNDTLGNMLMARYGTGSDWNYYIYFADLNGHYPARPNDTVYARSGGKPSKQKNPSYEGYTLEHAERPPDNNYSNDHWVRFYYVPNKYDVFFSDGVYVDGNNNKLMDNSSGSLLRVVHNITFGSNVDTLNSYVPELPEGVHGYVFDGWYKDKACTTPYTFDVMPKNNISVYAKWRLVEYRVFLHPQAGSGSMRDPTLDWGSDTAKMNFRVDYGEKVSELTGRRDMYEFGGWYLDENYQQRFFPNVSPLSDQIVTTLYDKTAPENLTDSMDIWGDIHNPVSDPKSLVAYNSDLIGNNGEDRFWVTRKLDLYARWRHKLEGADGVIVEYYCDSCDENTMPPTDTNLYIDKSRMVAAPGPKAEDEHHIFAYWILQRWDSQNDKFVDSLDASGNPVYVYPGGSFTLHLPHAHWERVNDSLSVYTYRLRAMLESFEDNMTFMVWYRNFRNPPLGDTVRYDSHDTVYINKEVTIPSAELVGPRLGYIFKGWHKKGFMPQGIGGGETETDADIVLGDTTTVQFIWYDTATKYYYSSNVFDPAHRAFGVAADEIIPYDYMYAVWEPIHYAVRFHKNTNNPASYGEMAVQPFDYDEQEDLFKNAFVNRCHKFMGWSRTPTGGVDFADEQNVVNLTTTNKDTIELYAVWSPVSPQIVVRPDSATCLLPGSIHIEITGESVSPYTYSVYVVDTNTGQTADTTVWQMTSSYAQITANPLNPGKYHVEVLTGTQCQLTKDTIIGIKPLEITLVNDSSAKVCNGSSFTLRPSDNPSVTYLWEAPEVIPSGADVTVDPDTANKTKPATTISGSITNNSGTNASVNFTVYPILGNCTMGTVTLDLGVGMTVMPAYTIELTPDPGTLCGDSLLEMTARVNSNMYNSNSSYTLNWVFNEDTISRTKTDHGDTIMQKLRMPNICQGDFSLEVYYRDVDHICRVSAGKTLHVGIQDWTLPQSGDSTVTCVHDAVEPHTISPSVMPVVIDGCGNILQPIMRNKLENLEDHSCEGTVTYTYRYRDCSGVEKLWDYVYTVHAAAPKLVITAVPAPTPAGNTPEGHCRYRIPAVTYYIDGCDPSTVTVTQTPPAGSLIHQNVRDSVVTVTLSVADKCEHSFTVDTTVTIPARPTVTPIANRNPICLGDTTKLTTVTTGTTSTPTWRVTQSTGEIIYDTENDDTLFTASVNGAYTLIAEVVENGCVADNVLSVTVNPNAALTITNKTQYLCKGAALSTIHVDSTASTLSWEGDPLPSGVSYYESNITGRPNEIDTFQIIVVATSSTTPQCGIVRDTITIGVADHSGTPVPIVGDTAFCQGGSTKLFARMPGALSYEWTKKPSSASLTYNDSVTVSTPGTYKVKVTVAGGCIFEGEQIVTENPNPVAAIQTDTVICPNEPDNHLLRAVITSPDKSPYSYHWTIDGTYSDATLDHNNIAAVHANLGRHCEATYHATLTVVDSDGCSTTVTKNIMMEDTATPTIVFPVPPSVSADPTGNCQYEVPELENYVTVTEDCTYGVFYITQSLTGIISATDSVMIYVSDACGHSDSTKIEVVVPPGAYYYLEKDTLVINSFEWGGQTYTESQVIEQRFTTVTGCDSIVDLYIEVLRAEVSDAEICEGDSIGLTVNVGTPEYVPNVDSRPAVGDVLCLKPAGDGYDTLVLRPDTYIERAADEGLIPMGVVFYVDHNDDRHGRALALVDANEGACQWANVASDQVTDGNPSNGGSIITALTSSTCMAGLTNTENILNTASTSGKDAPAARYCYRYDHLTQSTGDEHIGWYLPAAEEVNLWYVQRVTINRTLRALQTHLPSINQSLQLNLRADVPFDGNNADHGYWTSTDNDTSSTGKNKAWALNQKGTLRNHEKNRNSGATNYARAVYSY